MYARACDGCRYIGYKTKVDGIFVRLREIVLKQKKPRCVSVSVVMYVVLRVVANHDHGSATELSPCVCTHALRVLSALQACLCASPYGHPF
jgi:hypothetical protein